MSSETIPPTQTDSNRDEAQTVQARQTLLDRFVITIKNDRKALFGLIVVIAFVVMAIFAPWLAPHGQNESFNSFQEPNTHSEGDFNMDGEVVEAYHLMGTDDLGYDVLSRIIYGARISLFIAFTTVTFAFAVGTIIGLAAGYYGGWIDHLLMRYIDFQWAFPTLILAIGIIAFLGEVGMSNVIIAISIAFIDDFARIVRSEVLSIREKEYIDAARAVGMGDRRIMTKEILPNAVAPIIVQASLMLPLAILAEASLSFLGLGVTPDNPTWGLMLNTGMDYVGLSWWISIFPGLAIMAVVLGFNTFGDGLRDTFDISETEVSE